MNTQLKVSQYNSQQVANVVKAKPANKPIEFVIGEVPGVPVGAEFESFEELRAAGLHAHTQKGIWGRKAEGAASIVVSGGYPDDRDDGDTIVYTGEGGQDDNKRHVADQALTAGNLSLAVSRDTARPVRVIRGFKGDPAHSPAKGYRYDGLYLVDDYWWHTRHDGFKILRFRLERCGEGATDTDEDSGLTPTTTNRIDRDRDLAQWVKRTHKHACQICGEMISTMVGPYAEAAHIKPLGSPHNGPDTRENLLCLCPNCHVRFDRHAIYVDHIGEVRSSNTDAPLGRLRKAQDHHLSEAMLAYQRSLCGK